LFKTSSRVTLMRGVTREDDKHDSFDRDAFAYLYNF